MKQSKINFVFDNTYMDLKDYKDTLKHFLDDGFFWDLAPGFRKKTDIFVKESMATLVDDYVQLGQSNDFSFYQVDNFREQMEIEGTDLQFMSIYLRLDNKNDTYERKVYSFSDLLSQIGGVYQMIVIIGALFVGIFSTRLFEASILQNVYQIDTLRENEACKIVPKPEQKRASTEPTQVIHSQSLQIKGIAETVQSIQRSLRRKTTMTARKDIMKSFDIESNKNSSALSRIKNYIMNRKEFSYGYKEIFLYLL